jgi:hypothetical protein
MVDPSILVSEIVIERNISNLVYVWSGTCLVLFLFILWRMGLFKRAMIVVWVSFVANIGWEVSLILNDARVYDSGYLFFLELIYHGFTEFAPFVLFWMICLKWLGFIKKPGEEEKVDEKEEEREEEGEDK